MAHAGRVRGLAFAPDGATLISGAQDGLRLWDVATRQALGEDLAMYVGPISSVAFSPEGRLFVTGGPDGALRVWDASYTAWAAHACALAGHNLARREWETWLPKRTYRCTCPTLPPGDGGGKCP